MYCPQCATENLNEASFCRSCGADISLVPQALTGRLPAKESKSKASKSKKEEKTLTHEQVYSNIFVGIGFLLWFIIGAIFFTKFFPMWFWAIFPGFACLGSGIGQYARLKQEREKELLREGFPLPSRMMSPPARHMFGGDGGASQLPARDTAEIVNSFETTPRSVTEGTTRHLDHAFDSAPRRKAAAGEPTPTDSV